MRHRETENLPEVTQLTLGLSPGCQSPAPEQLTLPEVHPGAVLGLYCHHRTQLSPGHLCCETPIHTQRDHTDIPYGFAGTFWILGEALISVLSHPAQVFVFLLYL